MLSQRSSSSVENTNQEPQILKMSITYLDKYQPTTTCPSSYNSCSTSLDHHLVLICISKHHSHTLQKEIEPIVWHSCYSFICTWRSYSMLKRGQIWGKRKWRLMLQLLSTGMEKLSPCDIYIFLVHQQELWGVLCHNAVKTKLILDHTHISLLYIPNEVGWVLLLNLTVCTG